MLNLEVNVPDNANLATIEDVVEGVVASNGLDITTKGPLRSYPGSIHWHLKRGKESGTLEVTLWKGGRRLWLSVHANREGGWTTAKAKEVRSELEAQLRRLV